MPFGRLSSGFDPRLNRPFPTEDRLAAGEDDTTGITASIPVVTIFQPGDNIDAQRRLDSGEPFGNKGPGAAFFFLLENIGWIDKNRNRWILGICRVCHLPLLFFGLP